MKCCDVSSGTKAIPLHKRFTALVTEEFFYRTPLLPPPPAMCTLSFIARVCVHVCARCGNRAEGDMERARGMPVANFSTVHTRPTHALPPGLVTACGVRCAVDRTCCNLAKSQQGFLNFVVKPIFSVVSDVFPAAQVQSLCL